MNLFESKLKKTLKVGGITALAAGLGGGGAILHKMIGDDKPESETNESSKNQLVNNFSSADRAKEYLDKQTELKDKINQDIIKFDKERFARSGQQLSQQEKNDIDRLKNASQSEKDTARYHYLQRKNPEHLNGNERQFLNHIQSQQQKKLLKEPLDPSEKNLTWGKT